jgi:hypothetical protein
VHDAGDGDVDVNVVVVVAAAAAVVVAVAVAVEALRDCYSLSRFENDLPTIEPEVWLD